MSKRTASAKDVVFAAFESSHGLTCIFDEHLSVVAASHGATSLLRPGAGAGTPFEHTGLAVVERSPAGAFANLPASAAAIRQRALEAFANARANASGPLEVALVSEAGAAAPGPTFDCGLRSIDLHGSVYFIATLVEKAADPGTPHPQHSRDPQHSQDPYWADAPTDSPTDGHPHSPDERGDADGHASRLVAQVKASILDIMDFPIVISTVDGSVTLANKAMKQQFGLHCNIENSRRFEWMEAVEVYDCTFTRKLEPRNYLFDELCRNGTPYCFEVGRIEEDGSRKIYEVKGVPVYANETTKTDRIGGMAFVRDVTSWHNQLDESVRKSEHMFRSICNALPQFVWVVDVEHGSSNPGVISYLSPNFVTYSGLSTNSSNEQLMDCIHPEDRDAVHKIYRAALVSGNDISYQARLRSSDGTYRWVVTRAVLLRNDKNEIYKVVGSSTDIQNEIEKIIAAHRVREHLQCLVMNSDTSIWSVDNDLVVTMSEGMENSELGRLLTVGANARNVAATFPSFCDPIEQVLKGKVQTASAEIAVNGQWIRTRYMPIYKRKLESRAVHEDSEIEFDTAVIVGVVGVSSDITNRKLANLALEARTREVTLLQKKESTAQAENRMKSQFLATMSHEIRTPIAGVVGLTELLRDTKLDAEQREYLDSIMFSAKKLLDLVRDILDISKIEAGHMQIRNSPFDLKRLLADTCESFARDAKRKDLKFSAVVGLDSVPAEVYGDATRLSQVLSNLLHNSLKFTRQGRIRLIAEVEPARGVDDKVAVRFTVDDTGIGIKEASLPDIFMAFKQEDGSVARSHEGTGLGLAICKNLVELMGGKIGITSKYGVGTTAWFVVPFASKDVRACDGWAPAPAQDMADSAARKLEKDRKSILILVVEDNLINQQIAKKTLVKMGFSVATALNGKECLDFIRNSAVPDLILMDCQMPVIDGYAASAMLRQHPVEKVRNVPIVAMTASVIAGDREKCLSSGMDDYLAKPFNVKSLENIIVRWLLERQGRLSTQSADDQPFSLQQIDSSVESVRSSPCGSTSFSTPDQEIVSPLESLSPMSQTGTSAVNDGLISSLRFVELNGYVASLPTSIARPSVSPSSSTDTLDAKSVNFM